MHEHSQSRALGRALGTENESMNAEGASCGEAHVLADSLRG